MQRTLEIIACSLEDARAACAGGADRLEICSHLARQGMTPPVALVAEIVRGVKVPVRVMIRDTSDDLDLLEKQIQEFRDIPIEGIVFGTLTPATGATGGGENGGRLDFPGMDRVVRHAPAHWRWTLHRAFDWASGSVEEKLASIAAYNSDGRPGHLRIDRILTGNSWHIAPPAGIALIAGGGVTGENLPTFLASPCREFHFGRAARTPQEVNAPVDAERVRRLAYVIHEEITK